MLPPGAIFELKIHQNAFAAYTRLPRPPSWFLGGRLAAEGEEEMEREGSEGGKGRERSPLLFTM